MTTQPFSVPVRIVESAGYSRTREHIRFGVPLPQGLCPADVTVALCTPEGSPVPAQSRPLECWGDSTVKWLLVDAVVDAAAQAQFECRLLPFATPVGLSPAAGMAFRPRIEDRDDALRIQCEAARFHIPKSGAFALVHESSGGEAAQSSVSLCLTDLQGRVHEARLLHAPVAHEGTVTTQLRLDAAFPGVPGLDSLRVEMTLEFDAGRDAVQCEITLWNAASALHPGGLWDLGDPSSCVFRDLSLVVRHAPSGEAANWADVESSSERTTPCEAGVGWCLYQDSSGGSFWNSPNHVGATGQLTVRFPGYRVHDGDQRVVAEGRRATPSLRVGADSSAVGITLREFWQNFPKALRRRSDALELGLFPRESSAPHEIQGGEQKRHSLWIHFGAAASLQALAVRHSPLCVSVDPHWIEATGAVPGFTAATESDDPRYREYLADLLEGEHSVVAKRERIDEYGWRHFGDLHADHEAARVPAETAFPSHYNNQYDFIQAAFFHAQRTRDPRWQQLMHQTARHTIDIDLYRTERDRSVFNGGLFWHTDHYVPAATSTHRTYSRANAGGGSYGGGPSNEHNYTTGLLHYHLATGDAEARRAVLQLAEWVLAMDDGSQTLFGVLDPGPTGAATATVDPAYQKAGRGAGNSVNALLDAWRLTHSQRYLAAAESLLQRCIHPHDEVASLGLDQPEKRWSYLVFLQVLCRYLDLKLELDEIDFAYFHARDSLLAYARWMRVHERPFADRFDRVEIPSETWPAHDLRKSHVLYAAARFVGEEEALDMRRSARDFHHRALTDVLSWPTARYTRPQVILAVYGALPSWYEKPENLLPVSVRARRAHSHDFGQPIPFATQRSRLASTLQQRMAVLRREIGRMIRERWLLWRRRA